MTAAPRARVQRRPVHGVLLLDKPLGLSSNQALQKAKWLLRAEKAGHTGTLDPLASGVLPLCFGAATKFSQMHLDADKCYETVLRLGQKTTTGDAEGAVLVQRPVACSVGQLVQVLDDFTGPQTQIPPMHSALKKDGKALYEYARDGETVERAPRSITIHDLSLLDFDLQGENPFVRLRVQCSKGTYIRTLGEDIGEALGCGAHLSLLRRVATGPFTVQQCTSLEALEATADEHRHRLLQPVQALLADHTPLHLPAAQVPAFLNGVRQRGHWPDTAQVAVFGPAPVTQAADNVPVCLLGSAHVAGGQLVPGRLLSPAEVQQMASA
ncbi:MAG: tRNA pseudouridine synthase [Pseudomonadota bacterium]|jgi:tRNA pseudouridine55 synthase